MRFFIQKIFEGEADESVHLQFQKFSRGEFKSRAMVAGKKQGGGNYSVSTTSEYAKELVMAFAEKLGDEKTYVIGTLISAIKLEGFDYQGKKNAIGVNKYIIDKEMSGNEILDLCNKVDKAFFGLSFKVRDSELKIQAKSPKSTKGASSKKENAKVNFCKVKTDDFDLIKGLFFDVPEFKNIEISHDFIIDEIVITSEMKSSCREDFGKLREMALRKGRVVRKVNVDGKERISEKGFEV